jgi:hypothetical protein
VASTIFARHGPTGDQDVDDQADRLSSGSQDACTSPAFVASFLSDSITSNGRACTTAMCRITRLLLKDRRTARSA